MFQRMSVLCAIIASIGAASANAELIELSISGKFSGPATSISGTPFTGLDSSTTYDAIMVYDTTAPATSDPSGHVFYDTALQSMVVVFHTTSGDQTVSANTLTGTLPIPEAPPFLTFHTGMDVLANTPGDSFSGDSIGVAGMSSTGPGGQGLFLYFDLFSGVGNHPLNGISSLPSSISSSDLGGRAPFQFQVYPDINNVGNGSILSVSTRIVPCPPAAALIPLGSWFAFRRRRSI